VIAERTDGASKIVNLPGADVFLDFFLDWRGSQVLTLPAHMYILTTYLIYLIKLSRDHIAINVSIVF
jgi:hypothetical protein